MNGGNNWSQNFDKLTLSTQNQDYVYTLSEAFVRALRQSTPIEDLPSLPTSPPSELPTLADELSPLGFHTRAEGLFPGLLQDDLFSSPSRSSSVELSFFTSHDSEPQSGNVLSEPQQDEIFHPLQASHEAAIMPHGQINYPTFGGADSQNVDVFLMMLEFAYKRNNPDTSPDDAVKSAERRKEICCQIFCQCDGDAAEFLSSLDTAVMMDLSLLTAALKKQFPVTLSDNSRKQEARQAMRNLHQGSMTLDEYVDKAKQIKKYLHETLRPDLAEYFCQGLNNERVKENAIGHLHQGDTAFEDIVFKIRTITRSLTTQLNTISSEKKEVKISTREIDAEKTIQQLTGIIGNLSFQSRAPQGQQAAYPPQFRPQTQYIPQPPNQQQFQPQRMGQQQQGQSSYAPPQNGNAASGANTTPLGTKAMAHPQPTAAWVMGPNGRPKWPCDKCGTMDGCYPSNCTNPPLPQAAQDAFKSTRMQAQREWNNSNPNNPIGRRNPNQGYRPAVAANVVDYDPSLNGQHQLFDYPMQDGDFGCHAINFDNGSGIRIIAQEDDIEVAAVASKRHRGPGGKFTKEDDAFFAVQPPLAPEVQKAADKVMAEGMILIRPGETTIKGAQGLRDFDALSALRTYKVQMSFMTLADLSPTVRDQVIDAFQTEIATTRKDPLEPQIVEQCSQTGTSNAQDENGSVRRPYTLNTSTRESSLRTSQQPKSSHRATVEDSHDAEDYPLTSPQSSVTAGPSLRPAEMTQSSSSTATKRRNENVNAIVPYRPNSQPKDVFIASKAFTPSVTSDIAAMIAEADRAIPWFTIAACAIDSKDSFGRNFYTRAYLPNEGVTWEVPRTLIDGGSLLSFISTIAVEKMDLPVIQTSGFNVNVANGSNAAISGRVQLPITVSGVSILQDLYIMPGTPPYAILLGRHWLKAAQAIGIYSLNEYWIRDGLSMMRRLEETHPQQIPRSYRPPKIGISGRVRQLRDLDVDENCLFDIAADIVQQSKMANAPMGKGEQL